MTTSRQIQKLMQPLVDRTPDICLVESWIILCPVSHFVRGIIFDRSSDKEKFRPTWAVMHLFEPMTVFHLSLGQRISGSSTGLWKWSNPEVKSEIEIALEASVLPMLRNMDCLEKYVSFLEKHPDYGWSKRPLQKLIVDIAMGDFDAARVICGDVISRYTPETFPGDAEDKAHFADLKKLCALLARDDRKGMAAMLHAFEAETVKNLKLEHVWEPTPFPFELAVK